MQINDKNNTFFSCTRRKTSSLETGLSDPANNGDSELAPMKCSVPGCTKEFTRALDWAEHAVRHPKPFKCSFSTCGYHEDGFFDREDLERHYKTIHSTRPDRKLLDEYTTFGVVTDFSKFYADINSDYRRFGPVAGPQARENVVNDLPNDAEDSETVYSVADSVSQDDMEMCTSQFAEALADFVSSTTQTAGGDTALLQAVGASLPELLRAFSLRLGCAGSSKAEREVMYFIHEHRV
jgi:hypothetical protein